MRKCVYSLLLVLALLVIVAPVSAKEWYEGGTLHEATIAQWKRASYQNKLATCGDWLSALYMRGNLNVSISGMDDLKRCAVAVVDYIDKASANTRALDKENANAVALMGMTMAGLIKQNGDTSSGRVLIEPEPEPVSPQEAAENADKKLKENHFLLEDEIDEILEAEQTPNVLDKLTKAQQEAIVKELRKAQSINAEESKKFGASIKEPLEQAAYRNGVYLNKMLKTRRAIAKKYGIQAGDIATVEAHVMFPD